MLSQRGAICDGGAFFLQRRQLLYREMVRSRGLFQLLVLLFVSLLLVSDWIVPVHGDNRDGKKKKKLTADSDLLKAAGDGDVDRAKFLLEEEFANLHAKNNYGVSALVLAANNGHLKVVELLLKHGADMEDASNNGKTPFHWACHWGHFPIVKFLASKGANISTVDYIGMTPLMTATLQNHVTIVRFLLANGVNLHSKNVYNATALSIAENKGDSALISLIRSYLPRESSLDRLPPNQKKIQLLTIFSSWIDITEEDRNPFKVVMKIFLREVLTLMEISFFEIIYLHREAYLISQYIYQSISQFWGSTPEMKSPPSLPPPPSSEKEPRIEQSYEL